MTSGRILLAHRQALDIGFRRDQWFDGVRERQHGRAILLFPWPPDLLYHRRMSPFT